MVGERELDSRSRRGIIDTVLLCKPTKYISRTGGEYDYAFARLLVCDRAAGWSIVRLAMRMANEAEGCEAQCHGKPKAGQ